MLRQEMELSPFGQRIFYGIARITKQKNGKRKHDNMNPTGNSPVGGGGVVLFPEIENIPLNILLYLHFHLTRC